MVHALTSVPRQTHALAEAIGRDRKRKLSIVGYLAATPLALALPLVAFAIYVAVVVVWIVPDRRMERSLTADTTREAER